MRGFTIYREASTFWREAHTLGTLAIRGLPWPGRRDAIEPAGNLLSTPPEI
jgi:hypothetical protein